MKELPGVRTHSKILFYTSQTDKLKGFMLFFGLALIKSI